MFEDLMKLCQVCVVDVKVIHAFEIALHVIQKSFIDQFNNFVPPYLLCFSAMWGEWGKIVISLMPMCHVETDLLQVMFLHLKSILQENVSRDHIDALRVMHICLISKLFGFVVEMLQGFTLK